MSTAIAGKGTKRFDVTGALTGHGVSREITLPVEFIGTTKDPMGRTKAAFETSITLNLNDFCIT